MKKTKQMKLLIKNHNIKLTKIITSRNGKKYRRALNYNELKIITKKLQYPSFTRGEEIFVDKKTPIKQIRLIAVHNMHIPVRKKPTKKQIKLIYCPISKKKIPNMSVSLDGTGTFIKKEVLIKNINKKYIQSTQRYKKETTRKKYKKKGKKEYKKKRQEKKKRLSTPPKIKKKYKINVMSRKEFMRN